MIEMYWETIKDQYPNLSFEKIREVCKAPFEFIKYCIGKRPDLPKFTLKWFGKIRVYPSTVKNEIKKNDIFYSKGFYTYDDYMRRKKFFEDYLKKLEEDEKDDTDVEDTPTI